MKKLTKILSLFVLASAALVLVACGKVTTVKPTEPPTTTVAPTTVKPTDAPTTTVVPTTTAPHVPATEWSKDETNHWHACTTEGCTEVFDKAAHTWDEGKITTPSTNTTKGVKTYTCTVCGQTKTEELELAYDFAVADGAYCTDYQSKQADDHYDCVFDETENILTVSSHADWGWNAIVSYSSGATEGYGLIAKFKGNEKTVAGSMFVVKPNDMGDITQYFHVEPTDTEFSVAYIAGSNLPATMEKMVVMLYPASSSASIQLQWVKLAYAEDSTATLVFNPSTNKIESRVASTTAGFESYYKVIKEYEVQETTIADELAKTATDNTPFIIKGYVTEVGTSATGRAYLVDGSKNIIQVYGISALGKGMAYTVNADGTITAKYTSDYKFSYKDENGDTAYLLSEGDYVEVIAVYEVSDYGKQLHLEFFKVDHEKNLQSVAEVNAKPVSVTLTNGTSVIDKESYKFGELVTVTVTPTEAYYVKTAVVKRASGAEESAKIAGNTVTYNAGVSDTVTINCVLYKYETNYSITSADVPSSYQTVATGTVYDGVQIDGVTYNVMKNGENIQMKKGGSFIASTQSVGVITSISMTRTEANASFGVDFTVYVSETPFTTLSGLTAYGKISFEAKGGTNDAPVYDLEASLAISGPYQYFAVVNATGYAQYPATISVSTALPTTNVVNIMDATVASNFGAVEYNGGLKYTGVAKNGWWGLKGFAQPATKVKYLVCVVSATGYTNNDAYSSIKFDDNANVVGDPGLIVQHITSEFSTIVIDLANYKAADGTDLGAKLLASTQTFKVVLMSGEVTSPVYYLWQCYVVTEPSA